MPTPTKPSLKTTIRKEKLTAAHIEGFVKGLLWKEFDNPAETPQCHREWWEMCCSNHKFVAIAAPRGHAKSTAITLCYTLANILFRERKFILLVSDTEAQSSFFLNNIKRTISQSEEIKHMFHVDRFVKDTETDFIIEFTDGYQARILAKGSEQKLRGINWDNSRPDLIVCDDMENDEIVMSDDRREKFRRWFNGALLPCRSNTGIVRYVGTILHMDSLLERLMPKDWDKRNHVEELKIVGPYSNVWYAAKYRANTDDWEQILWPEYKDRTWLQAERESYVSQGLGDVYSQEYLNIPIDESNSFFRRLDFSKLDISEIQTKGKRFHYYLGTDLAVSLKNKADFSCFIVGGIDDEGILHIVEVVKGRFDSLEIIDTILALNKKYDFEFCVFEKGALTLSILPVLNQRMIETGNYVTLHTLTSSVDKMTRAQSIRARMRAGAVKFYKEAEWYYDFEREFLRFPRDIHDDQVDAISLLGRALDKFVEAPTLKEVEEEQKEDAFYESGLMEQGRCEITGY